MPNTVAKDKCELPERGSKCVEINLVEESIIDGLLRRGTRSCDHLLHSKIDYGYFYALILFIHYIQIKFIAIYMNLH